MRASNRAFFGGLLAFGLNFAPGCSCGSPSTATDDAGTTAGVGTGTIASSSSSSSSNSSSSSSGGMGCGLRTCASANASCGPIGDGCGGTLDCGSCTAPETCGGGGTPFQCGGHDGCVPKTCLDIGVGCGPAGDGCGNLLQCGGCDGGQLCGGGGTPFQCGAAAASGSNSATTNASSSGGSNASNSSSSGGSGSGGTGSGSGASSAGSGGTGSGASSSSSGGSGGTTDAGACVPLTCASFDAGCGYIGDGCGGSAFCGGCDAGGICGIDVAFQCGQPDAGACQKLTCGDLDAGCGYIGDGCGGVVECGGCDGGAICGGGGVPNQCGVTPADGGLCEGLCKAQVTCSDGGTTYIRGTVYAATNPDAGFGPPDPLPNATVYIANGAVAPFTPGVVCDVCGAPVSGDPLVLTTSMEDGGFVLANVPVTDAGFTLVVQLGRWRRQVQITQKITACGTTDLTPDQTRLPRNQAEGDIPLTAMVTGNVDSVECVLRKMGIDDSEFTNPDGGGRIQLYVSDGDAGVNGMGQPTVLGGANAAVGNTPAETLLTDAGNNLLAYDQVIFACPGAQWERMPSEQNNLIQYANAGGRIYTTHYNYVWLFNDPPFENTANWNTTNEQRIANDPTEQITVNTSFPTGSLMGDWLQIVGASTTPDVIPLGYLREDFLNANAPSQNWLTYQLPWTHNGTVDGGAWPIHYTFNTPVDAGPTAAECGRVIFSDFHVENSSGSYGQAFPSECTNAPMTAQEKVLEFMLFNLASCVQQQDAGSVCAPLNCAQQGYSCGQAGDGCGAIIDCGGCDAGTMCSGIPATCQPISCQPRTCQDYGFSCGQAGDGCGHLITCGGCDAGGTCGGGGVEGECGSPPDAGGVISDGGHPLPDGGGTVTDGGSTPDAGGTTCTGKSCNAQNLYCGETTDGCGNILNCGVCDAGTCGGGGVPGQCGSPSCTPYNCVELGYTCGAAGDGCGGVLQCGVCDAGTCGGAFVPNQCGSPNFE